MRSITEGSVIVQFGVHTKEHKNDLNGPGIVITAHNKVDSMEPIKIPCACHLYMTHDATPTYCSVCGTDIPQLPVDLGAPNKYDLPSHAMRRALLIMMKILITGFGYDDPVEAGPTNSHICQQLMWSERSRTLNYYTTDVKKYRPEMFPLFLKMRAAELLCYATDRKIMVQGNDVILFGKNKG